MRIAYLTQWFEPEPNIVKGVRFVQALEAAGHEVTVITGIPNYPSGRIYPGYRLLLVQHETIDGVRVVRLPLYPSHSRSSLLRSLNYLSFFLSAFIYLTIRKSRFDLAYVYHPPITAGLAAAFSGTSYVLDVQDLWPDTIAATKMKGASKLVGPIDSCCRFVYSRAAAIITQSEGMRRTLLKRGVPAEKLSVVRNWANAETPPIASPGGEGEFTLVYGGNLGPAQQLGQVIDVAAMLEQARPDIRILIYGSGLDEGRLRRQAERLRLTNVRFGGRISSSAIRDEFARADALLLSLGSDPLFSITIPSKTQFYLAMGRPIIAAVNGEAAQILQESGAAMIVRPADPERLASAIIELADMPSRERERMGQAGLSYYAEHLSFSRGTGRTIAMLEDTYEALAAGSGQG